MNEGNPMKNLRKGVVVGAAIGGVVLALLVVGALMQSAPAGASDRWEWFASYSLIAGFPTSFALSMLMQAVPGSSGALVWATLAVAVVANWVVLGGAAGFLFDRFRRPA